VEQLRQVFAELHAVTLRDTVGFANPADLFDRDGQLQDNAAPRRRMEQLLAYLDWWAIALRDARCHNAYQEVGLMPS
jgi:hypothetical protein